MLLAAGWLGYDRVYGRGDDRPLAWRDHTAALGAPAFRRAAAGAFSSRRDLAVFLDREVRGRVPPLPRLDFARRVALLATAGPRSSTGYAVEIVCVVEQRRRVVVRVRERAPGAASAVVPRVTYPFRLLTAPDTGKPVEFVWEGR